MEIDDDNQSSQSSLERISSNRLPDEDVFISESSCDSDSSDSCCDKHVSSDVYISETSESESEMEVVDERDDREPYDQICQNDNESPLNSEENSQGSYNSQLTLCDYLLIDRNNEFFDENHSQSTFSDHLSNDNREELIGENRLKIVESPNIFEHLHRESHFEPNDQIRQNSNESTLNTVENLHGSYHSQSPLHGFTPNDSSEEFIDENYLNRIPSQSIFVHLDRENHFHPNEQIRQNGNEPPLNADSQRSNNSQSTSCELVSNDGREELIDENHLNSVVSPNVFEHHELENHFEPIDPIHQNDNKSSLNSVENSQRTYYSQSIICNYLSNDRNNEFFDENHSQSTLCDHISNHDREELINENHLNNDVSPSVFEHHELENHFEPNDPIHQNDNKSSLNSVENSQRSYYSQSTSSDLLSNDGREELIDENHLNHVVSPNIFEHLDRENHFVPNEQNRQNSNESPLTEDLQGSYNSQSPLLGFSSNDGNDKFICENRLNHVESPNTSDSQNDETTHSMYVSFSQNYYNTDTLMDIDLDHPSQFFGEQQSQIFNVPNFEHSSESNEAESDENIIITRIPSQIITVPTQKSEVVENVPLEDYNVVVLEPDEPPINPILIERTTSKSDDEPTLCSVRKLQSIEISEEAKALVNQIETFILSVIADLKNGNKIQIKVQNRTDWSNCSFEDDMYQLRPIETARIRCVKSTYTLTLIFYLLNEIHGLLLTNMKTTIRELYYKDVEMTKKQIYVTEALKVICCLFDTTPWKLGVMTSSKGIIAGDVRIVLPDNVTIDCSEHEAGMTLPHFTAEIVNIVTDAEFVLLVEKDTVFKKLVQCDVLKRLDRKCIVITGKGYPDTNTRLLLKKLYDIHKLPIYALTDADPYGIEIMLVYRHGSRSLANLAESLAVPSIRWIGIFPSDIEKFGIKSTAMTKEDNNKLKTMLERPYISDEVCRELLIMKDTQLKAEIEGISDSSCTYLIDVYLRNKLKHNIVI